MRVENLTFRALGLGGSEKSTIVVPYSYQNPRGTRTITDAVEMSFRISDQARNLVIETTLHIHEIRGC